MPPKRKNVELDVEEPVSPHATRARTRLATASGVSSTSKDKPASKLHNGDSSGSGAKASGKRKKMEPETVDQGSPPVAVNGKDFESNMKERKSGHTSPTKRGLGKSSKPELPLSESATNDDDNGNSKDLQ
ncbi:hypothetical protein BS47DRAFT_328626 [Hydnum rufescens UP504]|uniref:Uncharacterized protein n=1 Tax=Hydnum rufescens UP504 TaxID=1448309 RepID=A0A9P6B649_9AGAM|nr:hypothetical protein BS47DRAFT_328626 [Hydnum rufescens UP504]